MNKQIWKFPFGGADNKFEAPIGTEFIHIGPDPQGQACIWGVVDTLADTAMHEVHVVGTGQPFPEGDLKYLATTNAGPFVWHSFVQEL